MATLHIHFDESGDWKFHPKGSAYFILTAAWTYDPLPLAAALTDARFRLIREGHNIESFHAAPDKQSTRNLVVQTLLNHDAWQFGAIVIEKRKVNPVLRPPQRFYPKFASILLKFILRGRQQAGLSRTLVYADTIPMDTNAKKEGVIKAIKTTCTEEHAGCTHHVFSHRRESNPWLQAVDYCSWAICRKWEHGDPRTYDQLRPRLARTELDVTASGDQTTYY